MSPSQRPVTISTLKQMKDSGERISMLTAYDFTMATLLEIIDHACAQADLAKVAPPCEAPWRFHPGRRLASP